MKSWTPFRENFSATHLGRRPGAPGAGRPGSRCAAGETLCARAAHPSSSRRPVRRSPQAAAAAAAAGLRSPGWPREGPLQGARSPWHPRQMPAGERAERERDLERRGARPQLCEPPLERLGGRWAGGRAGMARGDTYIGAGGGGEGRGGRGGKPHPRGTRGAAGGGGEGGGVWSALDPGSGPARRWGSRPGRRAREEPAAPGPAGGSGAGRAAMQSAAPQSEGPRRAVPASAPSPAPAVAGPGSRAPGAGCAADGRRQARGQGAPPAPGPRFGRTLRRNWLKVFGDGLRRYGREDGDRRRLGGSREACWGLGASLRAKG